MPLSVGARHALDRRAAARAVQGAALAAVVRVASTSRRAIFTVIACPNIRRRKNPTGTGSLQDHTNEADRSWLQGVALAFFSQVRGGKLTELSVRGRPTVVQGPLVGAPYAGFQIRAHKPGRTEYIRSGKSYTCALSRGAPDPRW